MRMLLCVVFVYVHVCLYISMCALCAHVCLYVEARVNLGCGSPGHLMFLKEDLSLTWNLLIQLGWALRTRGCACVTMPRSFHMVSGD